MANDLTTPDPRAIEFLKQIPRAAICGHRQHDGIEERVERLTADLAEARAKLDARAVALAQYRAACLLTVGALDDEVQCAICLHFWAATAEPHHEDDCILARTTDDDARGASILAAADRLNDTLSAAVCDYLATPGMTAQEFVDTHMAALIEAGDTDGCYGHLRAEMRKRDQKS